MTFETFAHMIEGPYHKKKGETSQDAVEWYSNGDVFIAAIADGAGSLKFSADGAQTAVKAVVETAAAFAESGDLYEITEYGFEQGRAAQRAMPNAKEAGSTLTVVAINSEGHWVARSLGDSFVIFHNEDGSHRYISGPSHGEYANITALLTSENAEPAIFESEEDEPIFAMSLSTDGLEGVGTNFSEGEREAHPGFWNGIAKRALDGNLEISALFEWLDSQDQIVDDTTLLTVVRR